MNVDSSKAVFWSHGSGVTDKFKFSSTLAGLTPARRASLAQLGCSTSTTYGAPEFSDSDIQIKLFWNNLYE